MGTSVPLDAVPDAHFHADASLTGRVTEKASRKMF
jgi:hypothetical protein